MKIALLGSEPTSLALAPFSDPSYEIWACSPGVYPVCPRVDEFFELHRPEFGQIGKPETQNTWFSPEYVLWLGLVPKRVWVSPKALPECKARWPRAEAYPIEEMTRQFGNTFWTSSLAYMSAMAIDYILQARQKGDMGPHLIAYFGVDMAADSEVYSQQRAGCHHFISLAHILGIELQIPPESDLARPTNRYGIDESEAWHIKGLARLEHLENQRRHHEIAAQNSQAQAHYFAGAKNDHEYHMRTWMTDRDMLTPNIELYGQSPHIRGMLREQFDAEAAERTAQLVEAIGPGVLFPSPTPVWTTSSEPEPAPKIKPKKRARKK